jgi:hypothetical protein
MAEIVNLLGGHLDHLNEVPEPRQSGKIGHTNQYLYNVRSTNTPKAPLITGVSKSEFAGY